MDDILITGSAGLVGSESVRFFCDLGYNVLGIDNDMRQTFFGKHASTAWQRFLLQEQYGDKYVHYEVDIRDEATVGRIFERHGADIGLVIHAAAQPSHDWAAREPFTDFTVNANGTLMLLENSRLYCPGAVFIHLSTNKVYGNRPNELPLLEQETRWEIAGDHRFWPGIDESMSIDQTLHSLFGASKVAADVLVQEYGRYFGLRTACFRGGCLTGPGHAGAELHGFLAYLMRCTVTGTPYRVFGYLGKQVRDNLHSYDLANAFYHFFQNPRVGEVYNMGGGRHSNCSMLEAIALCEQIADRQLDWTYVDDNRLGDHMWWITDLSKFQDHYPAWNLTYRIPEILREIFTNNVDRWTQPISE